MRDCEKTDTFATKKKTDKVENIISVLDTKNIQKQKFMWTNQSQKLGSSPIQVIVGQIFCSGPISIVSSTNNFITKLDKSYFGGTLFLEST